jgi:hypothetical protein
MKASDDGIAITKAELGCLLDYAGKNDFAVVHFRVNGSGKLVASAGDGKRSVQCTAPGGGADAGEWTVPAFFLERVRRSIDKGKTDTVLEVEKDGLKCAHLVGAASRTKQMKFEDETRGTSTQVSIEELRQLAKDTPLTGSWFALQPKQVSRALNVLSKAADGCPVTYYPPQQSTGLLLLECTSEDGCRWLAALPTALVEEPGDTAADEPDDDDRPGQVAKQPPLPGTEDADDDDADDDENDGGIVDNDYPEKLATQKPAKKNSAKKPAKKAAKKKATRK